MDFNFLTLYLLGMKTCCIIQDKLTDFSKVDFRDTKKVLVFRVRIWMQLLDARARCALNLPNFQILPN